MHTTSTTAPAPAGAPVRVVDGVELPAPGTWRIDPGHTEVGFVGRHLVFTKVRGRFRGVEGRIDIAEDPGDSVVEVTIDMTSVESGSDARDEHLRSADLFDVANHPTATFRGRAADWQGTTGRLAGEHIVRKGETLSHIERRNNTSVSRLMALNGLKKNVIYPGQAIRVRSASSAKKR